MHINPFRDESLLMVDLPTLQASFCAPSGTVYHIIIRDETREKWSMPSTGRNQISARGEDSVTFGLATKCREKGQKFCNYRNRCDEFSEKFY